jgi:predicted ABC-type ATPase
VPRRRWSASASAAPLAEPNRIYVLAGVNGAGKSSIAGAAFRDAGADYYNPDEAARLIRSANGRLSQPEANGLAWQQGRRLLERAIDERLDFAFESTLGASTIPRLLVQAAEKGAEVRIWYVGLASVELHIARVRARVRRGGHDIPEADIRRRFDNSRLNLIHLMPKLAALRVFDNSAEANAVKGEVPAPRLVFEMSRGRIVRPDDLSRIPTWAKPLVAAALSQAASRKRT